jgi:hypothetical protein
MILLVISFIQIAGIQGFSMLVKQLAPTLLETYSFFSSLWWHHFYPENDSFLFNKPSKIHRVPEFTWITYFHRFGFPSSQFTNSRNKRGIAFFGVGSSWASDPRHLRKISPGHLILGFICPEPMLWKIRISWGATLQGSPPLASHDTSSIGKPSINHCYFPYKPYASMGWNSTQSVDLFPRVPKGLCWQIGNECGKLCKPKNS